MGKISDFERLQYCIIVLGYNSSVKFDNFSSAQKYMEDLNSKGIKYETRTEYNQPAPVYSATVGK